MYEAAVLAQGFVSVPVYYLREYRRRIGDGDAFVLLVALLTLSDKEVALARLSAMTGWETSHLIERLEKLQAKGILHMAYVGPERIRVSLCLEEPEEQPVRPVSPPKAPNETRDPYAEVDRAMQVAMDNYAYRTQRHDYVVLKQLLEGGMPLDVILSGIQDVFRTHKEPKRIRSFAYVAEILKDVYAKERIKTMPSPPTPLLATASSGVRDARYANFYKLFPND
ncbi:MAG: hypothetical protein OWR62_09460 [Sulfobacillus thermotolerans]|jgi:hypothetical protein|nr:hypothetical protein [Sulfobacillus thermotolerans]